jgi:hypothetical protein
MKFNLQSIRPLAVVLLLMSCSDNFVQESANGNRTLSNAASPVPLLLSIQSVSASEGFEVGASSPKTAYDVSPTGSSSGDNVTLQGKSWNMFDALIGNLSGDLKSGAWSVRVRNTGKITMLFDVTTGISTVTIKHGTYSNDAASQWGLWYSVNSGSSWTQSGSSVTTTSTLQTHSFTINVTGIVRLEIRKVSGSSNRINFDDIIINDHGTGGGITGKKFLFDASHYENAGSADWQIDADGTENVPTYTGGTTVEIKAQRFPTPALAGITAGTAETYWKGGMSAWAVDLVKKGQLVETLPVGTAITYGNAANAQDLSNYDVFMVIEPNRLFSATEKTAIMNFVSNGGGLMMVADHTAGHHRRYRCQWI